MVRQSQKISELQQSKRVFGEGTLCGSKKENGWGWFSRIAAFFKGLGRPRMDDQVREEVVCDGRAIPAKKSNRSPKPAGVRSDNKSKTTRKSTGAAIRAAAAKGKAKSKTLQKGVKNG